MMCVVAQTHDLLRLRVPEALIVDQGTPAWVVPAFRRSPWVVVRRGPIRDGWIPVGLRGLVRSERFATFAASVDVADRLSPEALVGPHHSPPKRSSLPPFVALAKIASVLERRAYRWGPGGSVGFEIATGMPVTTPVSDLDVIVRQSRRLEPHEAETLLGALRERASPTRIDVILETPCGGVSLADLAANPDRVLVRTAEGRRLCPDPWAAPIDVS